MFLLLIIFPVFFFEFLTPPIGVGISNVLGEETTTVQSTTTTLSPEQKCMKNPNEHRNWTKINECIDEKANCENPTDLGNECDNTTVMGCGCADDYTYNGAHKCVLVDECQKIWLARKICDQDVHAKWTTLDNSLVEQPSCEVPYPKKKENGDGGKKIEGCKCNDNYFHVWRNESMGGGYGRCVDSEGCKEVKKTSNLPYMPMEVQEPVDGIEEDYDAVGWE